MILVTSTYKIGASDLEPFPMRGEVVIACTGDEGMKSHCEGETQEAPGSKRNKWREEFDTIKS